MRTMGEIVEEFNKLCQNVMYTLPELAREFANAGQNNLYLQVSDNTIEDISIWWDATNKQDFLTQQDYIDVLGKQIADEVLQSGLKQLGESPALIQQLQSEQELAMNNGFENFYYERFIPHQVGINHMDYGQRLRDAMGYQELTGILKVIQVEPTIHLTTDPSVSKLRSAFRLCLDLTTTNGRPLIDNVARGEMMSIFPKRCRTIN